MCRHSRHKLAENVLQAVAPQRRFKPCIFLVAVSLNDPLEGSWIACSTVGGVPAVDLGTVRERVRLRNDALVRVTARGGFDGHVGSSMAYPPSDAMRQNLRRADEVVRRGRKSLDPRDLTKRVGTAVSRGSGSLGQESRLGRAAPPECS